MNNQGKSKSPAAKEDELRKMAQSSKEYAAIPTLP